MTGNLNADNRVFLPTWLPAVSLGAKQAVQPGLLGGARSPQLAPPPLLPARGQGAKSDAPLPADKHISKSLGELCHEKVVWLWTKSVTPPLPPSAVC